MAHFDFNVAIQKKYVDSNRMSDSKRIESLTRQFDKLLVDPEKNKVVTKKSLSPVDMQIDDVPSASAPPQRRPRVHKMKVDVQRVIKTRQAKQTQTMRTPDELTNNGRVLLSKIKKIISMYDSLKGTLMTFEQVVTVIPKGNSKQVKVVKENEYTDKHLQQLFNKLDDTIPELTEYISDVKKRPSEIPKDKVIQFLKSHSEKLSFILMEVNRYRQIFLESFVASADVKRKKQRYTQHVKELSSMFNSLTKI